MEHPPCPPYTKPEAYAVECILDDIIAEEKRVNPDAHNPHFQLGYIKSLVGSLLAENPAAKCKLEMRLEYMKTLQPSKQ